MCCFTIYDINHLKVNGFLIAGKKQIAELIATNLSKNSSAENSLWFSKGKNYLFIFLNWSSLLKTKRNITCFFQWLNWSNHCKEPTIQQLGGTGVIITFSLSSTLLYLFFSRCISYNHVWESGCFLPSWCKTAVIPIPKPGKDYSDPGNFTPITLTSCLCKTMERMINVHLMWSLESQGLLSEKQCSFRKNHSMLDCLIHFETYIRNAFVNKEHDALTVFFDLEKGLWHDVEAGHSGRPLPGSWFQGPSPCV